MKPRPKLQRVFVHWLAENRRHFRVPVHIESITYRGIRLRFEAPFACLTASLRGSDFSVIAEVDGEYWDMLLSLDAFPIRANGRYKCSLCEEPCQLWPSRRALWIDHLFEPFLKWVNERLGYASGVDIGKTTGGSTWAELCMGPDLPSGSSK